MTARIPEDCKCELLAKAEFSLKFNWCVIVFVCYWFLLNLTAVLETCNTDKRARAAFF